MPLTEIWNLTPTGRIADWDDTGTEGIPTIAVAQTAGAPNAGLPATQPGPLDATGGYRAHRLAVEFALEKPVDATLELRFSSERGPCPDLEITIDGRHRGIFHPQVIRNDRSATGEPGPTAGPVSFDVPLPAAWLNAGGHRIEITTVLDEAAALGEGSGASHEAATSPSEQLPAARAHYGSWFGAYLRWYSLRLVETAVAHAHAPDAGGSAPSAEARVTLRPTPFYVAVAVADADGGDGEHELVDCDLQWAAGADIPSGVSLDWGGQRLDAPAVPAGRDFGMFRWRFAAPAFDGPTTVGIRVGDAEHTGAGAGAGAGAGTGTGTGAGTGTGTGTEQRIIPCRRWTLHLIPHVHLDLGFTDAQGKVLELHCRNIDRALDAIDRDPRSRFAVDGSMVVVEYQRTRTPDRVARMLAAIEDGTLGINAFHSNALTGVVSLDELYHSTAFGASLPRSKATSMRYANLTDVPTATSALVSVLLDQGIEGFVGMANHGRAATDTSDELHLASPVRWQGPDGRSILAHFADHYSQLRFLSADPQSVVGATNGIGRYLARYERDDYLPADLPLIGTHADNEDLADSDTGFVDRFNARFAWPRMRVSTFDEYLAAVAPLTDRLPVWRSESGSFWEDGVGSAAADFARYRRAQAALPAAETFGALVAAASGLRTNREEYDRAWNGLSVAGEHTLTWARGMSHPLAAPVADQFGWKRRYIDDAHRVSIDEPRRHLAQLAEAIDVHGPGFLVYNPHAFTADLEAEIDLADGIDLLDATGAVPLEVLTSCAGMRRVRTALPGMAPHSWRFLPMTAGLLTLPGGEAGPSRDSGPEESALTGFADTEATTIETAGWCVELDPATSLPRSLLHVASGRELVDPDSPDRLGQVIRAAAGEFDAAESEELAHPDDVHGHRRRRSLGIENFRYVPDPPLDELTIESPPVQYVGSRYTPDGVRLQWRGGGVGIDRLVIDLLLLDDTGTGDLDVRFEKALCLDMEAVYVAFPFAGSTPRVRYDRQLGWVEPAADHGPGASNEWLAAAAAVSIDSDEGEILFSSRDAPLFTVGDVVRGTWASTFSGSQSTIYSYAMNNFWPCNTPPTQSGPARFSYRFGVTDGFDAGRSSRFGRTARLPAMAAEILPLDRFDPNAEPVYREGTLGLSPEHPDVDAQLTEQDSTRAVLRLTSLAAEAISTSVMLPDGYRPEPGRTEDGRLSVDLAAFGTAHVTLVRH